MSLKPGNQQHVLVCSAQGEVAQAERRMNYMDGLHVGSTYTTVALMAY